MLLCCRCVPDVVFLQVVKIHIAETNGLKGLRTAVTAVQLLNVPCIVILALNPFTDWLYYFDERYRVL